MEREVGDILVRALEPDDVGALVALRREALAAHPFAFTASAEDDRGLSVERMRSSLADAARSAVFGAFEGASLVGMVGLYRPPERKLGHRADVWGMYVSAYGRGRGAGAALLGAAIEHCRAWPGVRLVHLAVSETAPEAARLYERLGFRAWGREPRAVGWEGRFADEHHMVLDLDGGGVDLDHIVVVAPTLAEGTAYVRDLTGAEPFEGGRHRELGTHNMLLRLGADVFLEIIAPDPAATAHVGPRVFGIGTVESVRVEWGAGRRLRGYVGRTTGLDAIGAEHGAVLGGVRHVTRGERAWRMLIPSDGGLPLGGLAPTVVEYEPEMVPASRMPEAGCELVELVVAGPDAEKVRGLNARLGLRGAVSVREAFWARLVAVLSTPSGMVALT